MDPKKTYYQNTAETVMSNLKKRQIEGWFCDTKEEALKKAASYLTPQDTVAFGGSMTLEETGLLELLRRRDDIRLLDRSRAGSPEAVYEVYQKAFGADCYFMSTNAITLEGELVNIDGNGNRVAALIYGPKNVIILAGMNKVVPGLKEAYARVKNCAAPPNCIRLGKETPCAAAGFCHDCQSPDCICSQTVITRRSQTPGRIKVILIGETLGY